MGMCSGLPKQLPLDGAVSFVTELPEYLSPDGAPGEDGEPGAQGLPGVDGSTWYSGTGAPPIALGTTGDFYLDRNNGDVWERNGTGWSFATNLKGDAGASAAGVWLTGNGAPSAGIGKNGDMYLDVGSGAFYQKANGNWGSALGNLTGPAGQDGTNGATWLTGTVAPTNALGASGDLYLNTTTNDVYKKSGSAWSPITNLNGDDGQAGQDGQDGSTWRLGEGAPAGTLGSDGDYYLDTLTGMVFTKSAGTWTSFGDFEDWEPGGQRWFQFSLNPSLQPANYSTGFVSGPAGLRASFNLPLDGRGYAAFNTTGTYLSGGVNMTGLKTMQLKEFGITGTVTMRLLLVNSDATLGCSFPVGTAQSNPIVNITAANATCFGGQPLDKVLTSVAQVELYVEADAAGATTFEFTNFEANYF